MKSYRLPEKENWKKLVSRPEMKRNALDSLVTGIIENVKRDGDRAVRKYSARYDGIVPEELRVSGDEIKKAIAAVPPRLKKAIKLAKDNIRKFHTSQLIKEPVVETSRGIKCWRRNIAIESAGLYIPGGAAPLFSTVLMLAIPASVAGCSRVVICTPPAPDGLTDPVVLYTAHLTGVNEIYKVGGAQAIAAMAYGTDTIMPVDKIFGPGNQYVTRAKQLVQNDGVAIDMPAGPSELLVIADKTAKPGFIAADLLSQAEHGTDSQVVLVTDCEPLIEKVNNEILLQLGTLPRKKTALEALGNSFAVILGTMDDCIAFSNLYAPEHLIITAANPDAMAKKVRNAGSVFLGEYSCESAGDYASGTNHTLPTNGYSRCYSGVSTESFLKKITFQSVTRKGLMNIGNAIEIMAEAEQLTAHKNAVSIRLNQIRYEQRR